MFDINEKEIKNIDRKARKAIAYLSEEYRVKIPSFSLEKETSDMFKGYTIDLKEIGFMPYYAECVFSAVEKFAQMAGVDIEIEYDNQAEGNCLFIHGIEVDQLTLMSKNQISMKDLL